MTSTNADYRNISFHLKEDGVVQVNSEDHQGVAAAQENTEASDYNRIAGYALGKAAVGIVNPSGKDTNKNPFVLGFIEALKSGDERGENLLKQLIEYFKHNGKASNPTGKEAEKTEALKKAFQTDNLSKLIDSATEQNDADLALSIDGRSQLNSKFTVFTDLLKALHTRSAPKAVAA